MCQKKSSKSGLERLKKIWTRFDHVLEYLAFIPNPAHIREGVVSRPWALHAVSAGGQVNAHSMQIPMRIRHRHLLRLLRPAFKKASYGNRSKFEAKVTFCGLAYADIAPSTIHLIDGRNACRVAIFPQVGSKPQEFDGHIHTINGTSTWTTLQSLSRA